ncbi:uncharacterized protein [Palaemon carinicauda]|uniref:uncharacterized protein isoform X1 n=1 Tax=Palaemon carinicauda TaxID=392227 RepID=UPI0035B60F26
MPFNLESFAGNPKEELSTLRYATKQDLRDLAAKCNIVVDPAYVKARLLSNILDYLINQEIIADDEEVQALRIAAGVLPPVPVDTEVEKIRLQLQLEKVKKETTERELYLEEKRAEAEEKRAEAEEKRAEAEEKRAEAREKEREAEIRHQKKLQELSLSNRKEATLPATFEVFKASKLVPDFDERDPEVFFQNFEQIAETLKWPVEFWSLLIRNKVKGKAAFVASQLVSENDYAVLKKTILDAYSITIEGYRQNFRNSVKTFNQTFVEFCSLKNRQLNKWLERAGVDNFESFKNLILLEEFLRKVPTHISTFIHFKGETLVKKAASLADDYHLIHKSQKGQTNKSSPSFSKSPQVSCAYCKKVGHTIENCPLPQCKTSKAKEGKNAQSRSTCHVTTPMEGLQPFEGFICDVTVNGTSLKCLRDSGSSQSILADLGSKNLTYTREFVTISDLTSSRTLPLAEVEIVSPYFTGKAKVAVLKQALPCSPVELILDNDLAGSQVKINFIISDPDFVIQEESKSIESPPAITQVVTRNTSRAGHLKSESKTTGRTMEALDLVNVGKKEFTELQKEDPSLSELWKKTNGALERFHQTLKNLLRKYSSETANHWDEDLDLLMYVFRCTPHDSTGISPFEALFGRRPRTVLGMVKENILHQKPEETTNTLQYIKDLKSKFHQINDLVCSNLLSSQQVMQQQGNKKARLREFQKGDQVLLYHPIPGAPLREKFAGPYTVLDRLSKVNYVISTPDRRKDTQLVHVNLLKRYQSRVNSGPPRVTLVTTSTLRSKDDYPVVTTNEDLDEEPELITISDLTNSEIMGKLDSFLSHLSTNESKELNSLLTSFQDLCTDDPGTCNLIQHDILLEPGTQPIRQPFYRAIGKKLESLRSEVQYLIDHKLAVPSTSPWASPCILVPKANGKLRLCTDYRRLNKVTIKNSFPLPRINDILDNISNSKILTQIDLLKGYYQVKLTPKAQSISAFVTPFGLFEYVVMPFGLSNAPATFQRLMAEVIRDLPNVYVYLDDIVIANMTWEEHLHTLSKLFTRLRTVDASGTGYGAVLLQSYAPNDTSCIPTLHYLPVAYHSRFFRGA